MLMLLAVLSVPRPVSLALGAYVQSRRRPGVLMVLDCVSVALLLSSIWAAKSFGPLGACCAVGVVFTLRAVANMYVLKVMDDISVAAQIATLTRPLVATVPMALAVIAVRRALAHVDVSLLEVRGVLLGIETLTGAVVYAVSALVIARRATSELIRLGKKAINR